MKYIGRLNRVSMLHRSRALEAEGINGVQHSYILRICQNPGITQEELSRVLYVHKSNVTRQTTLLEKEGYLTRVPKKEDRRVWCLFPTDKMLAVFPKVRAMLDEWNAYLLEDFSPEQRALLLDMLDAVLKKARSRVKPDEGEVYP
ncbi:MarR family transcriptional regulator [Eubacteriales bacterium OttesenSCG-928-A19]|nr:MarR family transcriptional regulator [Eubacteriales bacterium OttesenSCG-928-A19]